MDQQLIPRIVRVDKKEIPRKGKRGIRHSGPYWYGYYRENGRTVTVYIGKELPKQLERLINKRYRKPGFKQYTWPRPRAAIR